MHFFARNRLTDSRPAVNRWFIAHLAAVVSPETPMKTRTLYQPMTRTPSVCLGDLRETLRDFVCNGRQWQSGGDPGSPVFD